VSGVSPALFGVLLLAFSIRLGGQVMGSCPQSPARRPQPVRELRGVVVDQNGALVPKVKVRLQVSNSEGFREVAVTESGATGRFSFESQRAGEYRLVFTAPMGFCPAEIPVTYSKAGMKGIRLTLPIEATDTCPDYCESRLKVEEMTR
jgi:hypothetical protein